MASKMRGVKARKIYKWNWDRVQRIYKGKIPVPEIMKTNGFKTKTDNDLAH